MSTSAHFAASDVSVEPGSEQHVTLQVRNDGDVVESYRLDVTGEASPWASVEPSPLILYPGTAGTAVVTFRPPRSSQVPAGELPYAVRVLPTERPEGAVVPEGTVQVLPFHDLRAELTPESRNGRLRARFQTALENRGNTPVAVRLTSSDSAEQLRCVPRPTVALKPGETAHADMTVHARKLLWRGKARQHAFQVRADGDGGASATANGSFVQRALLPGWLLAMLVLFLVLLVWFALLQPAVRSAARQSVDEQIQEAVRVQQRTTTPPLASRPGSSTKPGGPGADASGSAAGEGVGPVGRGGAQERFSILLQTSVRPGEKGTDTFTVPGDRMVLVTDIVANAPQGDAGTFTVSIGGEQVTSMALENFRNNDTHWVTPVQAPPGSRITLSVTCRMPGRPPHAPVPRTCAESLFVNGTSVAASASPR